MSDAKKAREIATRVNNKILDKIPASKISYELEMTLKYELEQVRKETAREIVELMNENKITPTTYGGPHALDLYTIVNGKINDNNFLIKQRYNLEGEDE